ncbi:hypothetical protein FQN57_002075 [Myotisia sp. PD_48]|nr:hypothetical protein FQN57_002075 [Myotisia sp. PD_48]
MTSAPPDQDEQISNFCAVTGVNPTTAREHLAASDWNLDMAMAEFYNDEAASESDPDADDDNGRQLGGDDNAPTPTPGASTPSRPNQPPKRFATLRDISSGHAGDGDDSSDDEDKPQDMFAGGEKSGLAVQNPDDVKKKIIEKAKKAIAHRDGEAQQKPSYFTGTARTLGGDDVQSEIIPDTNPRAAARAAPPVQRTLHFWNDGFSVDDGDLYRTDDPRNAQILEGIRQGRAPLSIMNVEQGQDVDVQLKQHDSNYVKPKMKYKPFSGAGQRLGSPTPGVNISVPSSDQPAASKAQASVPGQESQTPHINDSEPIVTLQIRLGDGTRLSSRFNTTHTIGDVYEFVTLASPASLTRPWVLMTTFPSTELSDKSAVLGELKEFQRGGVVVQKWT